MKADLVPLIVGAIVFLASLISLKLGLSVAIVEIALGAAAGNLGLNSGFINQIQYSVLVGVVIASAVIPTFIAQRWFRPVHSEDIVENETANGKNESKEQ
jgi:hypothetical protein